MSEVASLDVYVDCVDKMVPPTSASGTFRLDSTRFPFARRKLDNHKYYGVTDIVPDIEAVVSPASRESGRRVELQYAKAGKEQLLAINDWDHHVFSQALMKRSGELLLQFQLAGGAAAIADGVSSVRVRNDIDPATGELGYRIDPNSTPKDLKSALINHIGLVVTNFKITGRSMQRLGQFNFIGNTHHICGWFGEQDTFADQAYQDFGPDSREFLLIEEKTLGAYWVNALPKWRRIVRLGLGNDHILQVPYYRHRSEKAEELNYTFQDLGEFHGNGK